MSIKKISVLIPTFNREAYIEESLKSILNQTYKDLDIIVYDDGSIDKTISIIKRIMKIDKRIKLIKDEKNRGVGYARNILLQNCNTKYACWHDSDDISTPLRIELQMKAMNNDTTLIFCKWLWISYNEKYKRWSNERKQNSLAFATLLFPIDKSITFNPKMKMGGEDWDWINKMRKIYKQEKVVENICYKVRKHNDRIGAWKRKTRFNDKFPKDLIDKLSYKELIEYYKKHYE